jgi:hypothetical protein
VHELIGNVARTDMHGSRHPNPKGTRRLSGRAALELCTDVTARAYCPAATSLEASTTSGDEESAGASAAASCDAPESAGAVVQA